MSLHIGAAPGSIAPRVLLPGDPLRARHIAETFLENPVCVNEVRGMYGFTGTYRDMPVSVQATGMGIPSIGIYLHELLQSYAVQDLVRVGTCGTFSPSLQVRDLLIASGATNDSAVNHGRFGALDYSCVPDWRLLSRAASVAEAEGIPFRVGQVLTMDEFYDPHMEEKERLLEPYGVLACDMETSELYTQAAFFKARALSVMTVSDSLLDGTQVPAMERQTKFDGMVRLALETLRQESSVR